MTADVKGGTSRSTSPDEASSGDAVARTSNVRYMLSSSSSDESLSIVRLLRF